MWVSPVSAEVGPPRLVVWVRGSMLFVCFSLISSCLSSFLVILGGKVHPDELLNCLCLIVFVCRSLACRVL